MKVFAKWIGGLALFSAIIACANPTQPGLGSSTNVATNATNKNVEVPYNDPYFIKQWSAGTILYDIAVGADDVLYANAMDGTTIIKRYKLDGTFTTSFSAHPMTSYSCIAYATNGFIFWKGEGSVYRYFTTNGSNVHEWNTCSDNAWDIANTSKLPGVFFYSDRVSNKIYRYHVTNNELQTNWNTAGYYLAAQSSSFLYISIEVSNCIHKVDTNGALIAKWGSLGTNAGQLSAPTCLAVDANDNVYVYEKNNYRVQKFDSNGTSLSLWGKAGSSNGALTNISSIALDRSNYVYLLRADHYILKFSPRP